MRLADWFSSATPAHGPFRNKNSARRVVPGLFSLGPPQARVDPRDPLLHSERTQGFTADPDYWKGEVFVYVGRNQNLKDLKDAGAKNTAGQTPLDRVKTLRKRDFRDSWGRHRWDEVLNPQT